ncbi:MAG: hypothetical protein RIT18_338 [Actinomycetota bacterium]
MSQHAMWMSFRSLTADASVKDQRLKAGTVKRIASYAAPYRTALIFFLLTVVVDAVLVITSPLLLKRLIDDGVMPGNPGLVTQLALLVGLIAILDAIFSMIGRWFSARIGENLIFDLRTQVFSLQSRATSINCFLYADPNWSANFANQFRCDWRPAGIHNYFGWFG